MRTYIIPIKIDAVAIIEAKNRNKAVRKVAVKKHKFRIEIIGYKVDHPQIKACDREKIFKNKFKFNNYPNNEKAKMIEYLLDAPNKEQGRYYDDLGLDI
ncbi:MAG: hypothetical protein EBU90_23610 [Proteobacteria bacterium]|nr:hypothetical protein [Pseudomonadota bacterium]NBP16088.1 hypothetical protein [bacterium]